MVKVVKSTRLNPHCLSALSFCINFLCLLFVVWQSLQCTTKYLQKPQGTEVSTQKAANFPYPAITICGRFQWNKRFSGFNKTYLENVCGIRWVFLPRLNSNLTRQETRGVRAAEKESAWAAWAGKPKCRSTCIKINFETNFQKSQTTNLYM